MLRCIKQLLVMKNASQVQKSDAFSAQPISQKRQLQRIPFCVPGWISEVIITERDEAICSI